MTRKFPRFLYHQHTPESIKERISQNEGKASIRDFIYGAIDGIVTTFAIVAGVKGANLSEATILILGFSNIVADGFSMAASNYLGTKAEQDERKLLWEYESTQIDKEPEGEEEEIRQIFIAKGFKGELLDNAVKLVVEDRHQWVEMMLAEEYGLSSNVRSPIRAAGMTFFAFMLFGLIPLIPYLLDIKNDFFVTTIFTGIAFYILGSLKSLWSLESSWMSGIKTLFIGSLAASFAYFIGVFLKDIAG